MCRNEDPEKEAAMRDLFNKKMEPSAKRLLSRDDAKAFYALGEMYFFEIYFDYDMDKAEEYFEKAAALGYHYGDGLLEIIKGEKEAMDEDDEDDEEDED